MAKWTERELAAIAPANRDYDKFLELVPETDKSYDAFEVKSRRIYRGTDPLIDADEAKLVEAEPHKEEVIVPRTGGFLGARHVTPDVVNFNIAFFDIEATDLKANFGRLLCMSVADMFGNVVTLRSDAPEFRGERVRDDRLLAIGCRDLLETYDVIVGWNSKKYDVPFIDSRLTIHDERPLRKDIMHIDPMYKAGQFSLALQSRRLDSVAQTFRLDEQKTPIDPEFWMDAALGDSAAMDYVVEHCEADVLTLRAAFHRLKPLIRNVHR